MSNVPHSLSHHICYLVKLSEVPPSEDVREGEGEVMGAKMKALELEIDSYKEACSSEEREKADIMTAGKKARGQVYVKTKERNSIKRISLGVG